MPLETKRQLIMLGGKCDDGPCCWNNLPRFVDLILLLLCCLTLRTCSCQLAAFAFFAVTFAFGWLKSLQMSAS